MRVIARPVLRDFWTRHPNAKKPLAAWYALASKHDWRTPQDIKGMFGSTVDFVGDNRVIFDIGGNKFRLIAHVHYEYRIVRIKFVGTHKDYDRIDPETV